MLTNLVCLKCGMKWVSGKSPDEYRPCPMCTERATSAKLRERLHKQTMQTNSTCSRITNAVLEAIGRHGGLPEGIDGHGHPIEQVVATVLSMRQCDLEAERQRSQAILDAAVRLLDECEERIDFGAPPKPSDCTWGYYLDGKYVGPTLADVVMKEAGLDAQQAAKEDG